MYSVRFFISIQIFFHTPKYTHTHIYAFRCAYEIVYAYFLERVVYIYIYIYMHLLRMSTFLGNYELPLT